MISQKTDEYLFIASNTYVVSLIRGNRPAQDSCDIFKFICLSIAFFGIHRLSGLIKEKKRKDKKKEKRTRKKSFSGFPFNDVRAKKRKRNKKKEKETKTAKRIGWLAFWS